MFRRGGNGFRILGIFAVALGAGILIAAIFPIGALLFLVNNEAAGFITGVVLPVDGGFSAYSGV